MILADKTYSSRAIRSHLRRRGIRAVIPQPADEQVRLMSRLRELAGYGRALLAVRPYGLVRS